MSAHDFLLPFAVGSTYKDGSKLLTMGSTTAQNLWGTLHRTVDASGRPQVLRCVHLEAQVTATKTCLAFDSDAGDTGRQASGIAGTAGVVAKPLHPDYDGKTLAANDIVYVVDEGFTTVLSGAGFTAGDPLATDNAGKLRTAVAGQYVVARAEATAAGANAATEVYVFGGLRMAPPAPAG